MISFNKKNRYVRIYSGIRHRMFKNFYQKFFFLWGFPVIPSPPDRPPATQTGIPAEPSP